MLNIIRLTFSDDCWQVWPSLSLVSQRSATVASGFLVAYSTLRLLKPSCDLEVTWTEEPLRKQLERVIDQIHSETASAMSGEKEPFSAPTFAYCFYLLRAVLQDGGASVGGDEEVMVKALDVLEAHTKLRSNSTTTGVDEVMAVFVIL